MIIVKKYKSGFIPLNYRLELRIIYTFLLTLSLETFILNVKCESQKKINVENWEEI